MATSEGLQALRRVAPQGTMTDPELGALLDEQGHNGAAAVLWDVEAARTAAMVDVSESGSSRKVGSVHANAKAMAETYRNRAAAEAAAASAATSNVARTRLMSR